VCVFCVCVCVSVPAGMLRYVRYTMCVCLYVPVCCGMSDTLYLPVGCGMLDTRSVLTGMLRYVR